MTMEEMIDAKPVLQTVALSKQYDMGRVVVEAV